MAEFGFSQRSTDHNSYIPIIWFAMLFAVISYLALTMRAVLSPYEVNYFIDAKRLFSVVIGAFILWLAIRAVDRITVQRPGAQTLAVLNIAIPGAIGLLLAREAYDLAASGEIAQKFSLNLRWMLTWIGYFGAAVAAFLALDYHRQLQSVTQHRDGAHMQARPVAATRRVDRESIFATSPTPGWLIDKLADEIANKDSQNAKALLLELRERAGYEVADTDFDSAARTRNECVSLINRLLDAVSARTSS